MITRQHLGMDNSICNRCYCYYINGVLHSGIRGHCPLGFNCGRYTNEEKEHLKLEYLKKEVKRCEKRLAKARENLENATTVVLDL